MSFFLRLTGSVSTPDEYARAVAGVFFNDGASGEGVVTAVATASDLDVDPLKDRALRFYLTMLQAYPYRCMMTTHEFGGTKFVSVNAQRDTPFMTTTKGANETFAVTRFDMFSDDVRLYVPLIASYLRLEKSAVMGRNVLKPRTGAATSASNVSLTCDVGAGPFLSTTRYSIGTRPGYRLRVMGGGVLVQAMASGPDTEFTMVRVTDNTYHIKNNGLVLIIDDNGTLRMGNVGEQYAAPLTVQPAYDHFGRFLIVGPEPDYTNRHEPMRQLAFDELSTEVLAPYYDTWEEPFHTFQIHPV